MKMILTALISGTLLLSLSFLIVTQSKNNACLEEKAEYEKSQSEYEKSLEHETTENTHCVEYKKACNDLIKCQKNGFNFLKNKSTSRNPTPVPFSPCGSPCDSSI